MRPGSCPWHFALGSVIGCPFSCWEGTRCGWGARPGGGQAPLESCSLVSPQRERGWPPCLRGPHASCPTQGRSSSCVMEAPGPLGLSLNSLGLQTLKWGEIQSDGRFTGLLKAANERVSLRALWPLSHTLLRL